MTVTQEILRLLLMGYRQLVSPWLPAACRFYPTCSAYAEQAIRNTGAVRGLAFAAWRILRCSPLSAGGVDHPPGPVYDAVTHSHAAHTEVTA